MSGNPTSSSAQVETRSWKELLELAQSGDYSRRKDAVMASCDKLAEVLSRLGLVGRHSRGDDTRITPAVQSLCASLPYGPKTQSVLAAIQLRNRIAHGRVQLEPADSAAAVLELRLFLRALAAAIDDGDSIGSDATRENRSETELPLSEAAIRLLARHQVQVRDESALVASLLSMVGTSKFKLLEGDLSALKRAARETQADDYRHAEWVLGLMAAVAGFDVARQALRREASMTSEVAGAMQQAATCAELRPQCAELIRTLDLKPPPPPPDPIRAAMHWSTYRSLWNTLGLRLST